MKLRIEDIADLPLLYSKLEEAEVCKTLNDHFKVHGNWTGLSVGETSVLWLMEILSTKSHFLLGVEAWAEKNLHLLRVLLGNDEFRAGYLNDDRLGSLLDILSDDTKWESFEKAIGCKLLHVYSLDTEHDKVVRLDATLSQSYRQPGDLFRLGFAKQKRRDLGQIKIMLSTISRAAMPLTVEILPGNSADDPLYIPAMAKVRANLNQKNLLFVGDKKMASVESRADVHVHDDYYVVPLPLIVCPELLQRKYLSAQPKELQIIYDDKAKTPEVKARYFEIAEPHKMEYGEIKWSERRVLVYKEGFGATQKANFMTKLDKAQALLSVFLEKKQGKKAHKTKEDVLTSIKNIHEKYLTESFFDVKVLEHRTQREIRKFGNKAERIEETVAFELEITRKEEAIEETKATIGWQIYATNARSNMLSGEKVIKTYWDEYQIEQRFDELHNKITKLTPIYLHKDHRVKALVRLLSLALKFTNLIQHQVREAQNEEGGKLEGLVLGNPGANNEKPTYNRIVGAFSNVKLSIFEDEQGNKKVFVTALSDLQRKLLRFLKLEEDVFGRLGEFILSG
jgi:transposase